MSRRVNMTVVLGISAIDVLCCALVSSLVLFLMFSSVRRHEAIQRVVGANELALVLTLPPASDSSARPELRVRLTMEAAGEGEQVSFWTADDFVDEPHNQAGRMVQQGGGIQWYSAKAGEPGEERVSIAMIHRPSAGRWSVALGYLDTSDGALAPADRDVQVNLSILGACESEVRFRLALGEERMIDSRGGENAEGCDPKESLLVAPER